MRRTNVKKSGECRVNETEKTEKREKNERWRVYYCDLFAAKMITYDGGR